MAERETKDHLTVTVIQSQSLARPDGRVAIRLQTKELGSIAFEVDQHAIDTLRRELATAETYLQRSRAATKTKN
jgi:hypothetical protein